MLISPDQTPATADDPALYACRNRISTVRPKLPSAPAPALDGTPVLAVRHGRPIEDSAHDARPGRGATAWSTTSDGLNRGMLSQATQEIDDRVPVDPPPGVNLVGLDAPASSADAPFDLDILDFAAPGSSSGPVLLVSRLVGPSST